MLVDAGPTAGVDDETEPAEPATASEQSKGKVQRDANDASRATSEAQYNRERQPAAAIGSGINQDPNGVDAGDAQLHRNVQKSPTNASDPSGLYNITFTVGYVWGNPWTGGQKAIVNASLPRIWARVGTMISESKAIRATYAGDKTLCDCERRHILRWIDRMSGVFKSVRDGMAAQDGLSLYHYDINPDVEMRTFTTLGSIVFNDGATPRWDQWSNTYFDQRFFHELTHLYGTVDWDSLHGLNNAVKLDGWYNGQNNLFSYTGDRELRKAAKRACLVQPPFDFPNVP